MNRKLWKGEHKQEKNNNNFPTLEKVEYNMVVNLLPYANFRIHANINQMIRDNTLIL